MDYSPGNPREGGTNLKTGGIQSSAGGRLCVYEYHSCVRTDVFCFYAPP